YGNLACLLCGYRVYRHHESEYGSPLILNMKFLRKGFRWILLALFLLPLLLFFLWFNRQVRQQNLDHALIEAIKRNDTPGAMALLKQGADANAADKPYTPLTFANLWDAFHSRWQGKSPAPPTETSWPSALLLATEWHYIDFTHHGRTVPHAPASESVA